MTFDMATLRNAVPHHTRGIRYRHLKRGLTASALMIRNDSGDGRIHSGDTGGD